MPKKYSINWKDEAPVSFEVNGATYASLEDVPNPKDRRKLKAMLGASGEIEQSFDEFDKNFDKKFAAMQGESKTMENLFIWIFYGVAVLMLVIAAVSAFFAVQKAEKARSADGVVVDMLVRSQYEEETRSYRDYYYPVVQFTAEDGETRKVEMAEGSSPQSYELREQVTVLYDVEHPLDARIESAGSSIAPWILPGIMGILGILFGGAAFLVKKFLFT